MHEVAQVSETSVSLEQAARALGVTKGALYQRLYRGQNTFGAFRPLPGGRWRVRVDILEQLVQGKSPVE